MTYSKDDGGLASPPMHDPNTHVSGMSLRDYFAAKALQGLLANTENRGILSAEDAYYFADAMLKERIK